MSGQAFINNAKVDNDGGGKAETDTLTVIMDPDILTLRKAAADVMWIAGLLF